MFLSGVLFVVFLAGCWLYCLTDATLAPPAEFPWLGKRIWIAVMLVLPVLGALAWVIARRAARPRRWPGRMEGSRTGAGNPVVWTPDAGLRRHPASQRQDRAARVPIGPDDDDEFLLILDRLISGSSDTGELTGALVS